MFLKSLESKVKSLIVNLFNKKYLKYSWSEFIILLDEIFFFIYIYIYIYI